ncbi:MAG: hypothetical protein LBE36_03620 [Flavobacteriaceae bacterium]|jgi:hypothetical protein|nr:hypothetical protein [Flavobacteriaceae bacterium]
MNRIFFTCLLISTISISIGISAQQGDLMQIDSLSKIVNNSKISRQEKIIPMAKLSQLYVDWGDSIEAKKLLNQARTLARKEKDSKYMIYVFGRELANTMNSFPRKITRAYKIIDSIYTLIPKTKDPETQAWGYICIAVAKHRADLKYDYDDCFKSLRIVEKLPEKSSEKYRLLYHIYRGLYERYRHKDKTDETIQYLNLMYQAAEKSGYKDNICDAMMLNLNFLLFSPDASENKNLILQNVERLEQYISKNGNRLFLKSYGSALIVLKNIYLDYPNAQSEEQLKQYVERFRKIAQNSRNYNIKRTLFILDYLDEYERKNYAKVIELYKEIIEFDKIMRPELISQDYENLYELYIETGQYQQAAEAMNESMKYYRELINSKTEEQRQLAEVKFETEKKNAELALFRTRSVLYLVIGSSVIVFLIFLAIIFNRRNLRLKLEKKNAEQKAKLSEYEKEIAQKRMVSTNLQMIKKNETLEKITQKSTDKEVHKLVHTDFKNDKS